MRGASFLYGLMTPSFMNSGSRLQLRETATKLIEEDRLAPMVESARRYVNSKFYFLFMAIFAFNPANFRRVPPWMMVAVVALVGFIVPFAALKAVTAGFILGLPLAAIYVAFIPFFVGFSLESSIESEADPDLARFRSWFFIQAKRTGKVPSTLKEISSSLTPLLRPYTEEEYSVRYEAYRKWAHKGVYAMFSLIALLVGWVAIGLPMIDPTITFPVLFFVSLALGIGPTMAADWFEQTRKPVLHDDPSYVIPDSRQPVAEPSIQEIIEGYESGRVWRGMRIRAWLVYHFGPLFAWDTEGLPLVGISLFELGMYVSVWLGMFPEHVAGFGLLVVLVSLLPAYAIIHAWRDGGGAAKALDRKGAYEEALHAATLQDLISKDKMLDVFQLGEYARPTKKATRDDIIVSLYVRSIPLWPWRNTNKSAGETAEVAKR